MKVIVSVQSGAYLQFPKPDCYLPVSQPVTHVISLNFNSLSLAFQVLSHTTQQSLYYFILHTTGHVFLCLNHGKSKRFLAFGTRLCISSMMSSYLLQLGIEASTEIDSLIPDSKGLQIKCSIQATSFQSSSCLESHGKEVNVKTRAMPHLSSTRMTPLACQEVMLLTGDFFQLHICFQNNITF